MYWVMSIDLWFVHLNCENWAGGCEFWAGGRKEVRKVSRYVHCRMTQVIVWILDNEYMNDWVGY